jgi:uncharacterized membrane protein (UPF0127 family)
MEDQIKKFNDRMHLFQSKGLISEAHLKMGYTMAITMAEMDGMIFGPQVRQAINPVFSYMNNMIRIRVNPTHHAFNEAMEAHYEEAVKRLQKSVPASEFPEAEERMKKLYHTAMEITFSYLYMARDGAVHSITQATMAG